MNHADFCFGALSSAIHEIAGDDSGPLIVALHQVKECGGNPDFYEIADLLKVDPGFLTAKFTKHFYGAVDRHMRFVSMIAAVEQTGCDRWREVIDYLRSIMDNGGDPMVQSIADALGVSVDVLVDNYRRQIDITMKYSEPPAVRVLN